jgi:hypothetical protein
MKNSDFRNLLHVAIGIPIAYGLFQTYSGIELVFQLVLTTIWTVVIGYAWEVGWHLYNKSVVDHKDVVRAVVSALVVNVVLFLIR